MIDHSFVSSYSVDAVLHGTIIHDHICSSALQKALDIGDVAMLPEFIAAKSMMDKGHVFWQEYFTVHTEENIGPDKKGIFYAKGDVVVVVVHGGGILTPLRLSQAYGDGLVNEIATYREEEFDALLEGKLSDGNTFPLYRIEEIQNAVFPRCFGVVFPYKILADIQHYLLRKKEFLENPLVLARCAGSFNSLETFFDKAQNSDGLVGSWHPFHIGDNLHPRGTLPIIRGEGGIGGGNLFFPGRFVAMKR